MIVIVATLQARPEAASALEAALRIMVRESRLEPGTLAYGFCREGETFALTECYVDEAACKSHSEGAALKAFFETAGPLLAGAPTIIQAPLVDGFGFGASKAGA
ncbi:putative quinol monooxygenase [Holophaga foetida]|uniref:putative quinol monooxygenase n=1 Tax=Holophaga foetida TaxID=35839 RepID=UPI0002471806|nr:antibiotic biosynthesis monooxygenase [Holophaga foetida]